MSTRKHFDEKYAEKCWRFSYHHWESWKEAIFWRNNESLAICLQGHGNLCEADKHRNKHKDKCKYSANTKPAFYGKEFVEKTMRFWQFVFEAPGLCERDPPLEGDRPSPGSNKQPWSIYPKFQKPQLFSSITKLSNTNTCFLEYLPIKLLRSFKIYLRVHIAFGGDKNLHNDVSPTSALRSPNNMNKTQNITQNVKFSQNYKNIL